MPIASYTCRCTVLNRVERSKLGAGATFVIDMNVINGIDFMGRLSPRVRDQMNFRGTEVQWNRVRCFFEQIHDRCATQSDRIRGNNLSQLRHMFIKQNRNLELISAMLQNVRIQARQIEEKIFLRQDEVFRQ